MQENMNIANSSMAVRKAQELILNFVKNNFSEDKYNAVLNVLNNCPVYVVDKSNLQSQTRQNDDILDRENVGGYATEDGIFIPENLTKYNYNYSDGFEADVVLSTIIHEYAHKLRRINSQDGNMFEEGFATVFAEACIMYSKINNMSFENSQIAQPNVYTNTSEKYKKAESQVKSILLILNQIGIDIQMIGEYIFGDEEVFISKCSEVFGEEFINYFKLSNSRQDQYYNDYENTEMNSETKLVKLISSYIKSKGISLEKRFDRNNILLYNRNSPTFERGVVGAGREAFSLEDERYFKIFENSVNIEREKEQTISNERKERIQKIINEKFSLTGKNSKDIYELIIDLGGEYFNRCNSDRIENKIYISELKKIIPNLEELIQDFNSLRRYNGDNNFFEDISLEQLSFSAIHNKIKDELKKCIEKEKQETITNIMKSFNACDNKHTLSELLNNINKDNNNIELNNILPDFNSFIVYFNDIKDKLPEKLDIDDVINYNSIYQYILNFYILKKEVELNELHKIDEELSSVYNDINKTIAIMNNTDLYSETKQIINTNSDIISQKEEDKAKLENDNNNNREKRNQLVHEIDKINKRNFIIRFFTRNKKKVIFNKISDLDKKINDDSTAIETLQSEINQLKVEISSTEKRIIDVCGVNLKDFESMLLDINNNGITQEQLLQQIEEIKKKKQSLNLNQREMELENLYIKRNSQTIQQSESLYDNQEEQKVVSR